MTLIAVSPGLNFIGLGLAASAFWGASDFLGGLATRKAHVVLVVAMAHGLSLGLLLNTSFSSACAPESSEVWESFSTTKRCPWAKWGSPPP
jgi:hypothetical protein